VVTVIDLETTLREAGLRVTAPRTAVMRALETRPHADADEVFQAIVGELPGTSLQAVYVVLGALTEAGLVRRIEPAGSPARYERRTGDNHHHVVCTRCGAVDDVDCVHGEAPCLTPSSTGGYAITTAEVTFWGLCPACQAADSPARD
jgi:Fur family transcriptional regulator, stress-responsive regulator